MALTRFFANGVIASFEEPNQIGEIYDFDAPRNAPAKDPGGHMSALEFHSECDYFELVDHYPVNVSHAALAGATITNTHGDITVTVYGNVAIRTHVLVSHNLGYIPKYWIAYNGSILCNGTTVHRQDASSSIGRGRRVSHYATTTQILLREIVFSNANAIAATSRNYLVKIFRTPVANPELPPWSLDPEKVQFARGKIRSDRAYLREVLPAESSFDADLVPVMDINHGGVRVTSGGNTYQDGPYAGSHTGGDFVALASDKPTGGTMTKFTWDNGALTHFKSDGSVGWSSDARRLFLLPDAYTLSVSPTITFPDFDKSNYMAAIFVDVQGGSVSYSMSLVTALPEESRPDGGTKTLTRQLLGTVPKDANYLDIRGTLNRTQTPSNWSFLPIQTEVVEGQETWLAGGCAVLENRGSLARGIRIVMIDDNPEDDVKQVYLERLQSVAPRSQAQSPLKSGAQVWTGGASSPWHGVWTHGGRADGWVVSEIERKPAGGNQQRGGPQQPSTTDNTNYTSVWSTNLTIRPGYIRNAA